METETLIIGSGVAGSLLARELLRKGYGPVLMLEAGPAFEMRRQRSWLDYVMTKQAPYSHLHDLEADFSSSGVAPWYLPGGRLFGRGGSTIHWGGWTPRAQPEDFLFQTNTGEGHDWPYDYDALEPFYCQAEAYLQVAGDSDAAPARSQPYPLPPAPYPASLGPVIEAIGRLGYSSQVLPIARNTRAIAGQAKCQTIGTCDYCPIGARFTGDQPLDALADNPDFTLMLDAPVQRLLMSSKTEVTGVEYLDNTTGELHTVDAARVFLCAGALEIPKLLMVSTNADWPDGIGNDADLVGRHVVASPFLYVRGQADQNPDRLQAELNFPTLCSRHWDTPTQQLDSNKLFVTANPDTPAVDVAALMNQGRSAADIDAAIAGPMAFELWGALQEKSLFENRVTLGDGTTRFGLPQTKLDIPRQGYTDEVKNGYLDLMSGILTEAGIAVELAIGFPQRGDHAMCTTRMSTSDTDGVVGPDLRVHGVDNLYIASNAVMPYSMAANPTLTLVAVILKALADLPER